ncbi:MAG: 50S ribosomal protein L13 [Nitrospira sp.]|nr:50S ribosomal protein L13 [bacterium]MBL7049743.1 50S ribosomal protein L13 [Nitrospira sp.]
MKTLFAKKTDVDRKWYVVDADDQVLGRLASQVATVLRGKHKATFTPHTDTGDFIVIVNAGRVRLTGNKMQQKAYYHHTGYPGGIRKEMVKDILKDKPERVIESAVRGMLPKNKLGRQLFSKLKVYGGPDHPHQSQNPEKLILTKS